MLNRFIRQNYILLLSVIIYTPLKNDFTMGTVVNLKVGDAIYCVDPQRLIIQKISIERIEDGYGSVATSETSAYGKVKKIIKIALSKFPVEYNRVIYFKTENDAEAFVKAQIGI